ncbi:MAG: CopD family protein [Acidimicrobiales bacterium]
MIFVLLGSVAPAGAHTGFESSDPADGDVVEGPLSELVISFTGDSEETGDGFQVLDGDGNVRIPASVSTDDTRTFILMFDPPLAAGQIGVRWSVKAPDLHPIEGSYAFELLPSAAPAVAEQPPVDDGSETEAAAPSTQDSAVGDLASASEEAATAPNAERGQEPASEAALAAPQAAVELDEFLISDAASESGADRLMTLGRSLSIGGTIIGVGALVFAVAVLRGARRDIWYVLRWVRRSGWVVAIGGLLAFGGRVLVNSGDGWASLLSWSELWPVLTSVAGAALALRLVGGTLLATGVRSFFVEAHRVSDPVVALKEFAGVGATSGSMPSAENRASGPPAAGSHSDFVRDGDEAWDVSKESAGAFVGAALVSLSFLFDGHTVSRGNRFFTGITDMVHLLAGSIWAGGAIMLMVVLWRRHRGGHPHRALQLGLRFSVIASVSLVAVGVSGVALAVIVLDSVSELWTTPWGQLLVAKLAIVAVAAACGGYNHRVVIPALDADHSDRNGARLRAIVTVEAIALAAVIVVTAILVGAAS